MSSSSDDVTLQTVIDRLAVRPGVTAVTLATISTGLVVQTTLTGEVGQEEARRLGRHFSALVRAALETWEGSGSEEKPELLTVRAPTHEWVLTMADGVHGAPEKSDLFFIVARNPKAAAAASQVK